MIASTPTRLLTAREAAERLAVAEKTVRKWAYQGRLPAVQLGRAVRFRPADVVRVIKTGSLPPARLLDVEAVERAAEVRGRAAGPRGR